MGVSQCRLRAAAGGHTEQAAENPQLQQQQLTCRRCFQRFSSTANSAQACRFHPAMFTGGEVAKVRTQQRWCVYVCSNEGLNPPLFPGGRDTTDCKVLSVCLCVHATGDWFRAAEQRA